MRIDRRTFFKAGTPVTSGVAPTVVNAPVLASAQEGVTATYIPGTYAGTPTPTLAGIQWTLDGTPIAGATGATYNVPTGDATHSLRVAELVSNTAGSITGTSNAVTVAAASTTPTSTAPIGINWGDYSSGDRPNVFVDMMKQGGHVAQCNTGSAGQPITSFDSNGWPNTDFRIQPHLLDVSTSTQVCYGAAGGWFDSFAIEVPYSTPRMSLTKTSYDATNNITYFTVTVAPGGHEVDSNLIAFYGTRRTGGSTGTINTGLSYVKLAHPGYAVSDIGPKIFTNEYITFAQKFKCIRFMDALNVTNDITTTAFNQYVPTTTISPCGVTLIDMINLCNATGLDGLFNTMVGYTDAAITSFVTFIHTNLNAGLHFYLEIGNENWNFGEGPRFGYFLDLTAAETQGFYGGSATRNLTFSRNGSNVGTITTQVAHGWTVGQTIYITDNEGTQVIGNSNPTLITASGTTATFANTGPVVSTTSFGSNVWVLGNISTDLAAYGNDTNLYGLQQRYVIRRQKQISDLARAVVGNANMQSRCRIIWADQMQNGGDPSVFDYIGNTYTSRPVGGGSNGYFYGWAGAPYLKPATTATDPNATVAAVVAELVSNAASMKYYGGSSFPTYAYESRILGGAKYGLVPMWYEGGPDTTAIGSGSAAACIVRAKAMLDPGLESGMAQMLTDWFCLNGGLAIWFTSAMTNPNDPTLAENSQYACWAVTDSITDFSAPKMEAFINTQASGVAITRNLLSASIGTLTQISGGANENNYGATVAYGGNSVRYSVYARVAGTYSLSMLYSATGNTYTAAVITNNGSPSSYQTLVRNTGTYPDYSSSNTTTPVTITLAQGTNCINLISGENHGGNDVMWRTLNITRVS